MPVVKFPFRKQLAYTCGMIGWSMMTNTIIVMLPYFYLPPSNSGLKPFVPQLLLFGVVNILSLIAASGRFVDAVYDPLIASFSDKSTNKQGRRIPFMKWAILPAIFFFCLTFYPLVKGESMYNAYWLTVNMICFFMSATTYIIPYNALLPELTETAAEKVKLSSFQQVGFIIGIIFSALINNFADLVQKLFTVTDRDAAVQYTIWSMSLLAGLCMLVPVLFINEKKNIQTGNHLICPSCRLSAQLLVTATLNITWFLIFRITWPSASYQAGCFILLPCCCTCPSRRAGC
ncbi:MFS transporter [Mucilaginibacter humi]|uniref:MFS transporter n=1 Tax=Mucilaginibacter humi TaxID=2732510 RepID=UPI003744783A